MTLTKLASMVIYPVGVLTCLLALYVVSKLTGRNALSRIVGSMFLILFFVFTSPVVGTRMMGYVESQYPAKPIAELPKTRWAVTLGGSIGLPVEPRNDIDLTTTSDRVLHTAKLFLAGKVDRILLTGGNVFEGYHPVAEAEYVAELLQTWGVPAGAIHIEAESQTTYENAVNARSLLQSVGYAGEPLLLVTSASHMPRAMAVFRSQNINAVAAATDVSVTEQQSPGVFRWIPSAAALGQITRAWHEIFGIWVYRLQGKIIPDTTKS
ncbi:MAG: YdcF family protein [Pseudomonadota bacterium]